MKNFKNGFLFLIVMSAIVLSACGDNEQASGETEESSGEEYEFNMSYVTQTEHNWHSFAEKFQEELEERSDGRMTLELFPAAQLGPEADMFQQMESGSLDFALFTVPYLSTRVPEFDAWNMPFLFENLEEGIEATNTDSAQEMLDLLENQGIKGLGYMHTGTHSLLVKDDPILNIDDVAGVQLRFTGGESVIDFWNNLNASTIAMGLPEVYNSLQTGVIDGTSIDTNALLSEKYHEVADNYILTKHMIFGGVMAASLSEYENMPEGDREILDEALQVSLEWGEEQLLIKDKEDLEEVESLIDVHELENRDEFVEEAQKTHERFSEENEVIKTFIDEVNN